MPRTRRSKRDIRETEIRSHIGAIRGVLNISEKQLAELAGIRPSTLNKRLRKNGDLGSMRLSELWAIQDVGKRYGVLGDKHEEIGNANH